MRLKLFRNAAAFMSLGVLLAGCSESLMPEPGQTLERDTDFYINVKIATPAEAETRADNTNFSANDYVDGEPDEQKIHKILFVFYNSDHQYVGNATYTPSDGAQSSQEGIQGSIETIMSITVPVTVAAGSTKPAYVMAYVNPTLKAESDLFNDYETALGAFRNLDDVLPSTKENGHKGFAMNNSVHYEAEKDNELPTIAIPISDDQLFTSEEKAKESTDDPIVIYVERVVAKVTLTEGDSLTEEKNTVTGEDGSTTYTLNFEVLGWGLSNLEKATFLIKNFRTDDYGNPTDFKNPLTFKNYKYGALEGRLNNPEDPSRSLTNPSWNFPGGNDDETGNWGISGHRSFWALSPTYYHKDNDGDNMVNIPSCADEIYDGTTVSDGKSPLKYRSYNDIYDVKNKKTGSYGKSIGDTQYTLEHTMQASMVSDFQKRAVTCAVVVGKYSLKIGETPVDVKDNFYIRKIMTEDGAKSIIYPSDDDMKKAYLEKNTTVYVKNTDNSEGSEEYIPVPSDTGEGGNEYFADFVIGHPFLPSPVPSRYVTLKLAKVTPGRYYYKNATGAFAAVTAANVETVNADLYNNLIGQLGGIEEYHNGYAYFEVPVRHLWGRGNKNIGEDEFVAQLGQYGIVRNHSYNIKVNGIEGIGIGISDPDAPIVPNVENDNYVVKTEIRVQRWRVVPTQEVTLRP